ncbi:MAG: hypothetical protein OEX19_03995 [Gammaproteobacteria bacterium]|nr:hypothetical protein [Gammaproteobacteria bacterium]
MELTTKEVGIIVNEWRKVDEFEMNTTVTKTKSGYKVSCNMGLWSVAAKTKDEALKEARHYFIQYWNDGEYDGTVKEKMIERYK